MSTQAMEQVLERVAHEPSFRERIRENPVRALSGYGLLPDERTVLLSNDAAARLARGVDPRVSKVSVF
jgi:hypothetical protein